jgi:hypothetical protein
MVLPGWDGRDRFRIVEIVIIDIAETHDPYACRQVRFTPGKLPEPVVPGWRKDIDKAHAGLRHRLLLFSQ